MVGFMSMQTSFQFAYQKWNGQSKHSASVPFFFQYFLHVNVLPEDHIKMKVRIQ